MKKLDIVLIIIVIAFVALGVYSNVLQQLANDRTRLPTKVITARAYQRWITNAKNKGFNITSTDFKLSQEVQIYNSKWIKVFAIDDPKQKDIFEQVLAAHRNIDKIIFSPSDREFIDYRAIARDGYLPTQVHFYGQKEDKIIDLRVIDCSAKANCYFDRAYFLSNDLFVVSELSRNIDKKDQTVPDCAPTAECTYSFKLHLVDLINNSRLIYESKPFQGTLTDLVTKL